MFVCNLKINKKKFVFLFTSLMLVLVVLLMILAFNKIFVNTPQDAIAETNVLNITSDNYTNFLKDCHEDIDKYVGTTVQITGYVYRMPDFTENQFVIARTMLINSNNKAVVVGLLAESDKIKNFNNSTWVTCTGTIKKGNYNGDMPLLEILSIQNSEIPEDEFVYSPNVSSNVLASFK